MSEARERTRVILHLRDTESWPYMSSNSNQEYVAIRKYLHLGVRRCCRIQQLSAMSGQMKVAMTASEWPVRTR